MNFFYKEQFYRNKFEIFKQSGIVKNERLEFITFKSKQEAESFKLLHDIPSHLEAQFIANYRHYILYSNTKEVEQAVLPEININDYNLKDFHDCWWFLTHHPMFMSLIGSSIEILLDENNTAFQDALDISVQLVNPHTKSISDNPKLNTMEAVWLECGPTFIDYTSMHGLVHEYRVHDCSLDCGGDSFEESIIILASKVKISYFNNGLKKEIDV